MTGVADLLKAPGAAVPSTDDFDEVNELVRSRGWSDGLPVVPPTAERVEAMLAYCDRDPAEVIGKMAPRYGEATPLRLAANAVMAGCRPEYFPVIVTIIEALCEKPFNLYGVQATTHPVAPLIILNGPIAREIDMNSGHNAFGPGWQANATIGRAIRLAQLNIGGAIPALGDMSTMGSPAKYTMCVAENEESSPWEPLHVERGFPKESSTVTVIGAEAPHNVNDHESQTGEGILKTIAGTLATTGCNDIYYTEAQPLVIFGPEHAATVAGSGFSKADAKRFLYQHSTVRLAKFSDENLNRRWRVAFKDMYDTQNLDTEVRSLYGPDKVLIAVIGGAGKHSAVVPTFGATAPVTRAIKLKNGEYAKSVQDFRKH